MLPFTNRKNRRVELEARLTLDDNVVSRRAKIINAIPLRTLQEIYHTWPGLERTADAKRMRTYIFDNWPKFANELMKWVSGAFISLTRDVEQ